MTIAVKFWALIARTKLKSYFFGKLRFQFLVYPNISSADRPTASNPYILVPSGLLSNLVGSALWFAYAAYMPCLRAYVIGVLSHMFSFDSPQILAIVFYAGWENRLFLRSVVCHICKMLWSTNSSRSWSAWPEAIIIWFNDISGGGVHS
jgi:hypothetical protein